MNWLKQDWEQEYLADVMYNAPDEITEEVILPTKITFKIKIDGNNKRKVSDSIKSRTQSRYNIPARTSRKKGKS